MIDKPTNSQQCGIITITYT